MNVCIKYTDVICNTLLNAVLKHDDKFNTMSSEIKIASLTTLHQPVASPLKLPFWAGLFVFVLGESPDSAH